MRAGLLPLLLLVALAAGCGGGGSAPALPVGGEPVELDPADFVARIDNPLLPLRPGARWVYRETDAKGGEQRVTVTVLERTKTILGVRATVVHDVVTAGGRVVEDTEDWYAQDEQGNVWYLGEDTKEYDDGKVVSTAGSWQAGVDGAQAGVVMPAEPQAGMAYRQEYYEGEAEDAGEVLSLNERVRVPYGTFEGVLLTRDWTPLDPAAEERKYYARGVGLVLAVPAGGGGREELLRFSGGRPAGS